MKLVYGSTAVLALGVIANKNNAKRQNYDPRDDPDYLEYYDESEKPQDEARPGSKDPNINRNFGPNICEKTKAHSSCEFLLKSEQAREKAGLRKQDVLPFCSQASRASRDEKSVSYAHYFNCKDMKETFFDLQDLTLPTSDLKFSDIKDFIKPGGLGNSPSAETAQIFGKNCGRTMALDRIVGGSLLTHIEMAPWNAYIHIAGTHAVDDPATYGSAVLIGKSHLLTNAVNCIKMENNLSASKIGLGAIDLADRENVGHADWYSIASVKYHEFFNECNPQHSDCDDQENGQSQAGTWKNNICLIRLDRDVELSQKVEPICLPSVNECAMDRTTLHQTGYGYDKHAANFWAPRLRTVETPLVKVKDCQWIYNDHGDRTWVSNSEICSGGEDGKGACTGDAGGPLFRFDDNNVGILYGINSWQHPMGCGMANIPTVFTRITEFLDWIRDNSGIQTNLAEDADVSDFSNTSELLQAHTHGSCQDLTNVNHRDAILSDKVYPYLSTPWNAENDVHQIQASNIGNGNKAKSLCAKKGFEWHPFASGMPIVLDQCETSLEFEWSHNIENHGTISSYGWGNKFCWSRKQNFVVLDICLGAIASEQHWYYSEARHIQPRNDDIADSNGPKKYAIMYNKRFLSSPLRVVQYFVNEFSKVAHNKFNGLIQVNSGLEEYLTTDLDKHNIGYCMMVTRAVKGAPVVVRPCNVAVPNGAKSFKFEDGLIKSKSKNLCLSVQPSGNKFRNAFRAYNCASINSANKKYFQFTWDKETNQIMPKVYKGLKSATVVRSPNGGFLVFARNNNWSANF